MAKFEGLQVVCKVAPVGSDGPQVGWCGVVVADEVLLDGPRVLEIVWCPPAFNRAARRRAQDILHVWGFAPGEDIDVFEYLSFPELEAMAGGPGAASVPG